MPNLPIADYSAYIEGCACSYVCVCVCVCADCRPLNLRLQVYIKPSMHAWKSSFFGDVCVAGKVLY